MIDLRNIESLEPPSFSEGIGLILSIDWFLDRCRTTVNVWGDMVGAAVIDRFTATDPLDGKVPAQ